jgi:hypothetical protein
MKHPAAAAAHHAHVPPQQRACTLVRQIVAECGCSSNTSQCTHCTYLMLCTALVTSLLAAAHRPSTRPWHLSVQQTKPGEDRLHGNRMPLIPSRRAVVWRMGVALPAAAANPKPSHQLAARPHRSCRGPVLVAALCMAGLQRSCDAYGMLPLAATVISSTHTLFSRHRSATGAAPTPGSRKRRRRQRPTSPSATSTRPTWWEAGSLTFASTCWWPATSRCGCTCTGVWRPTNRVWHAHMLCRAAAVWFVCKRQECVSQLREH